MYDVVIIGAGPVGLFSTFYCAMRGLKTLTLEKDETYGGQLTKLYPNKPIYDLAGIKEITAKDYIDSLYNQYVQYKEKNPIIFNIEILGLIDNNTHHTIHTNKGTFEAKTILIASGNGTCIPRKLEVENANKCNNILYSLDNINKYINKKIAVLGGGDSAIDIANMLVNKNDVTVIHRRNEFRAHEESLINFKKNNGKILTPMNIESIVYNKNCTALNLLNKDTNENIKLNVDYVFVSYGLMPSNNIFNNILRSDINGILVNQSFKTSNNRIYAVGNACSYLGKVKTITSGLGECVTAITAIHQYIYPNKNSIFYSSINKITEK